jgi:predicted NBD/HSP70 family sugar kinase/biotin operon repressor
VDRVFDLPDDLSRTNVLALLGRSGPLSRAELARRLGVSAATVTKLTRRLLAEGLVRELDSVPSAGGRPAIRIGLSGDAGYAVGVKVTFDRVVGVVARLDGEVVDAFDFGCRSREPDAVECLIDGLKPHVDTAKSHRIIGIGVGLPGNVDLGAGGAVDSPMLGWVGVRLGPALETALGLPVLVDNDVNTVAVAERLYGHGRDVPSFLVATIGRGVGLGVLIDGRLYRGVTGGAGEFGHWPLSDDGPRCDCGNQGCLEAYVGDRGLVAAAQERRLLPDGGTRADLAELADRGDEDAQAVFAEAGALLGRSMAGLINVFAPGLVLVTGEGTHAWRHWQTGFQPALRAHLFGLMRRVRVIVDRCDDHGWARGAAALVLAAPFAAAGDHGHSAARVRARLADVVGTGRPA